MGSTNCAVVSPLDCFFNSKVYEGFFGLKYHFLHQKNQHRNHVGSDQTHNLGNKNVSNYVSRFSFVDGGRQAKTAQQDHPVEKVIYYFGSVQAWVVKWTF